MSKDQQFQKGDWVRVGKDLGPHMRHFTADCEAIVIGSYADQYGGDCRHSYTLHLKESGHTSWYEDYQLTLIESGRTDKLKQWEEAAKAEHDEKSNLDWIFANGKEVLNHPRGDSIQALADCFGLVDLWGKRGEGIIFYENSMKTLALATPFLVSNDKTGWLSYCKELKADLAALAPVGCDVFR